MATQENIEYLALTKCKMELTSEISADPLSVATLLVAKGLVPDSSLNFVQLQTVQKYDKASELVSQVTNKVKTFPLSFDEFLKVLGEFIWLKDILELITEAHDKLKSQGGNVSEVVASSTENYPTNFPYLKTPDLSDAQREKLKRRLKRETDEMMDRFAALIGRTLSSLRKHEVSMGELKATLKHSSGFAHKKNKITNGLEKVTVISDAFEVLYDFWSFFDYKILGAIIAGCCRDLQPDLDEYVLKFKEYCNRRVCEVPNGCYSSESEEKKKLHIQIDQNFVAEIEKLEMKDLKDLSDILEDILDTHLRILEIEDGSIILTFHCLHEFDVIFPLSRRQKEKLQEIGVTRIYTGDQEYYRYSPSPKELNSSKVERKEEVKEIMEYFYRTEMHASDLMKHDVCHKFVDVKNQLSKFMKLISLFKAYFVDQVLPKISRAGSAAEELNLAELISSVNESPFNPRETENYLKDKDDEIKQLAEHLKNMGKNRSLQFDFPDTDCHLTTLKYNDESEHVVCFAFNVTSETCAYLKNLAGELYQDGGNQTSRGEGVVS